MPVPPFAANQAAIAPLGSVVPSHSKVKSVGLFVQVGLPLSSTVIVCVCVVSLPQLSEATQVRVMTYSLSEQVFVLV